MCQLAGVRAFLKSTSQEQQHVQTEHIHTHAHTHRTYTRILLTNYGITFHLRIHVIHVVCTRYKTEYL